MNVTEAAMKSEHFVVLDSGRPGQAGRHAGSDAQTEGVARGAAEGERQDAVNPDQETDGDGAAEGSDEEPQETVRKWKDRVEWDKPVNGMQGGSTYSNLLAEAMNEAGYRLEDASGKKVMVEKVLPILQRRIKKAGGKGTLVNSRCLVNKFGRMRSPTQKGGGSSSRGPATGIPGAGPSSEIVGPVAEGNILRGCGMYDKRLIRFAALVAMMQPTFCEQLGADLNVVIGLAETAREEAAKKHEEAAAAAAAAASERHLQAIKTAEAVCVVLRQQLGGTSPASEDDLFALARVGHFAWFMAEVKRASAVKAAAQAKAEAAAAAVDAERKKGAAQLGEARQNIVEFAKEMTVAMGGTEFVNTVPDLVRWATRFMARRSPSQRLEAAARVVRAGYVKNGLKHLKIPLKRLHNASEKQCKIAQKLLRQLTDFLLCALEWKS